MSNYIEKYEDKKEKYEDKNWPKRMLPSELEENRKLIYASMNKARPSIIKALPKVTTLAGDRLIQLTHLDAKRNELLGECTPESVCASLVYCAQWGLEPGPAGMIFFIPRWNYNLKRYECNPQLGYRGMIELGFRSERVLSCDAECVYRDDKFFLKRGTDPKIDHEPNYSAERTKDNLMGAYSVVTLKDGVKQFTFLPIQEIEEHRMRSSAKAKGNKEGGTTGPWTTDYEAMAKKTAIRMVMKYIPMSVEIDSALYIDEAVERGYLDIHKRGMEILGECEPHKKQNVIFDINTGEIKNQVTNTLENQPKVQV